jgi:hypothetical protein
MVVLRSIAIPIVMITLLKNSFLGEQGAWLAVIITLTLVNLVSIVVQLLKILANSLLLKGGKVVGLIITIGVEIVSVIVFWIVYLNRF